MDLYGHHFIYAGIPSRAAVRGGTADLTIANVETSRYTNIIGEVETKSVFNRHNKRKYLTSTLYDSSPLEFDIEIVAEEPLDPHEMRELEKWLFNQKRYRALYVDMDDIKYEGLDTVNNQAIGEYLNCIFLNAKKIEGNGGIMGWSCTIQCDCPMAWQDKTKIVFSTESTPRTGEEGYTFPIPTDGTNQRIVEVIVDTDINDYTYPTVTLDIVSNSDTSVVNLSDSATRRTEFVQFSNSSSVSTIIMDGELNQLSGAGSAGDYYSAFSERNFIRLKDGLNKIALSENIEYISFEWQNMRWL